MFLSQTFIASEDKVTLLSALMSTECRFSEILPSRNFSIASEPIDLSKFCKKFGITHIHGKRTTYQSKIFFFLCYRDIKT